jgi:hypothetical protein
MLAIQNGATDTNSNVQYHNYSRILYIDFLNIFSTEFLGS